MHAAAVLPMHAAHEPLQRLMPLVLQSETWAVVLCGATSLQRITAAILHMRGAAVAGRRIEAQGRERRRVQVRRGRCWKN